MKKIIIITGQTATGKTSLALKKALEENGELINADSRQIYKHLDTITGKDLPSGSTFHEVEKKNDFSIGYYYLNRSWASQDDVNSNRHSGERSDSRIYGSSIKLWLYDVINPKQYFSSFDFVSLALPLIKKILNEGKTPIIIGGTYFYLYHLLYCVETNVTPNWNLRKELDNKTVPEMQTILKKLNLDLYKTLNNSDKNNPRRLMRKIEISMSHSLSLRGSETTEAISPNGIAAPSGLAMTQKITLPKRLFLPDLKMEYIGLRFKNKESLHLAVKKRVEERLKNGAVDEVKKLLEMGYSEKDPGLKTIGCKEIINYLKTTNSELRTPNELSLQWQIHEHQYAKKQNTFMKKDKNIKWREI